MGQYLARLVFEVTIDGIHDHFDRQLRIFAGTEASALVACEQTALDEEATFVARSGARICWRFVGISFFRSISANAHTEIIETDTVKESSPDSYSQYVRLLDAGIRTKTLTLT